MQPQRLKKAIVDNPKKLGELIDLVNLPSTLRDFLGQSQSSRLGCFMRVWSYIKTNNLQVRTSDLVKNRFLFVCVIEWLVLLFVLKDPKNKNVVNCDEKLKSILLGKPRVELVDLPSLIKLHFTKAPKSNGQEK